jgi:hypothetical protein
MTDQEFAEWFRYHCSRFTGMKTYLLDAQRNGIKTDDVKDGWFQALRGTALEDAKAATDSMHAGDDEEPMGYDRHPRAIRAIAARHHKMHVIATKDYGSPRLERLRCRVCRDCGTVRVWHWASLQAALAGNLGRPGTLYTMAVACTCEAGDRYAASIAAMREGNPSHYRFNDQMHLPSPLHLDDTAAQSDLKLFAEALKAMADGSRRYDEFSQFDGRDEGFSGPSSHAP